MVSSRQLPAVVPPEFWPLRGPVWLLLPAALPRQLGATVGSVSAKAARLCDGHGHSWEQFCQLCSLLGGELPGRGLCASKPASVEQSPWVPVSSQRGSTAVCTDVLGMQSCSLGFTGIPREWVELCSSMASLGDAG